MYRRRKRSREEEDERLQAIVARVQEEARLQNEQNLQAMQENMQAIIQNALAQQGRAPDGDELASPGPRKSSQASVIKAEDDGTSYPVDRITEPTCCRLLIYTHGIKIKEAEGQAWPCSEG